MKHVFVAFVLFGFCLSGCSQSGSSGSGGGGHAGSSKGDLGWQTSFLGQEGHGGDAVVCFTVPVDQALYQVTYGRPDQCVPNEPCDSHRDSSNRSQGDSSGTVWRLTDLGRSSIQSSMPLEEYLAARAVAKKTILDRLNQKTLESGYQELLAPLTQIPAAFNRIKEMHNRLGWLKTDGIASEFGLIDINDSGFLEENEIDRTHCKELQAVVRRDSQLWYDSDIVGHFDQAGLALMQLHEEIYTWGKQQDEINRHAPGPIAHGTSAKSRRLILKLVDDSVDTKTLNDNLKALGFTTLYWESGFQIPTPVGTFMDTATCRSEQQTLRQFFANTRGSRDYWLTVEEFFSKRYLGISAGQPVLALRNNYPDVLSNMIDLTMTSGGSSSTFEADINALEKTFELHESCEGHF